MKLSIDIDLDAAIGQALTPEKLGPILNKHVTDAVTSAISDATGYSSDFRKRLTAQMKEMLPHGLHNAELVKFQQVLNQAVTDVLRCANQDAVTTALNKAVQGVMPDMPPVVKVSELLKAARSHFAKEEHEDFYVHYKPSDSGGGWLAMDSDEHCHSEYRAKFRLAIAEDGRVYCLHLDGVAITPTSRPDIIGVFESMLMAMYVGRSTLEVDLDADEIEEAGVGGYD